MNLNDLFNEEKVRLDPKCWTGKKIGNPKTKMKDGVRVNNCVPAESVAEEQELDEKWSQKYKSSINCANPKGFSQKAHCAGRNKNEDVAEAKPPGSRRDQLDLPPLEGPGAGGGHQVPQFTVPIIPSNVPGGANMPAGGAPKWTGTKIPGVSSHTGPAPKVTQSPNINTKIDAAADVPAYVRRGLPDPITTPVNKPKITVKPGETQSQAMQRSQTEKEFGKFLQGQSGQTFSPGAGRGNTNPAAPNWKNSQTDIDLEEAGKQQKGADYRDPKEVDYDGEYDAMVARVKKLAGLGPMKTVYDPARRQYRNMPTAQQPKK